MCIISERTNSFEVLCYWKKKLSYSIEELCDTTNAPTIGKNDGIRELFDSITGLSNLIRELSNLFQEELNSRALLFNCGAL